MLSARFPRVARAFSIFSDQKAAFRGTRFRSRLSRMTICTNSSTLALVGLFAGLVGFGSLIPYWSERLGQKELQARRRLPDLNSRSLTPASRHRSLIIWAKDPVFFPGPNLPGQSLIRLFQDRLDKISATQDPRIIAFASPCCRRDNTAGQLRPGTQTFPRFHEFLNYRRIRQLTLVESKLFCRHRFCFIFW
jgi:hypothetical protein